MNEEQLASFLEVCEQGRERGEVAELESRNACTGEAVTCDVAGKRAQPPVGFRDHLEHPFVIALDQIRIELQRRRARDHGDVDLVAIERGQARSEFVHGEVDLPVAARKLEPPAAQPRSPVTRLEGLDQRRRPEMLMNVVTRHTPSMVAGCRWLSPSSATDVSNCVPIPASTRSFHSELYPANIGRWGTSSPGGTRRRPSMRSTIMFWNRCTDSSNR